MSISALFAPSESVPKQADLRDVCVYQCSDLYEIAAVAGRSMTALHHTRAPDLIQQTNLTWSPKSGSASWQTGGKKDIWAGSNAHVLGSEYRYICTGPVGASEHQTLWTEDKRVVSVRLQANEP